MIKNEPADLKAVRLKETENFLKAKVKRKVFNAGGKVKWLSCTNRSNCDKRIGKGDVMVQLIVPPTPELDDSTKPEFYTFCSEECFENYQHRRYEQLGIYDSE